MKSIFGEGARHDFAAASDASDALSESAVSTNFSDFSTDIPQASNRDIKAPIIGRRKSSGIHSSYREEGAELQPIPLERGSKDGFNGKYLDTRNRSMFVQFKALLKAEWLSRKRGWGRSLSQILVPWIIILIFGGAWKLALSIHDVETFYPTIYANQTQGLDDMYELMSKFTPYCTPELYDDVKPLVDLPYCREPSYGDYCFDVGICIDTGNVNFTKIFEIMKSQGPLPIPSFDSYIALSKFASGQPRRTRQRYLKKYPFLENLMNLGKLYLYPKTPQVEEFVRYMNLSYVFFNETFGGYVDDQEKFIASMSEDSVVTAPKVWALISFDSFDLSGSIDYTIRMNYTTLPSTRRLSSPLWMFGFDQSYKLYSISGFSSIQQAVEIYVLSKADGQQNRTYPFPTESAQKAAFVQIPMPIPAMQSKGAVWRSFGPFAGLFMALSVSYFFSIFVKVIVELKEKGLLDLMLISGMRLRCFYAANFLFDSLVALIFTLPAAGIIMGLILVHSRYDIVAIFLLIFALSLVPLAYFVSFFFKSSRIAGVVSPFLLLVLVLPRYAFFDSPDTAVATAGDDSSLVAKTIICLLSPSAFAFGVDLFMSLEHADLSPEWQHFSFDYFTIGRIMVIMLFDFFLYCFLAWLAHSRVFPFVAGIIKAGLTRVKDLVLHRSSFSFFSPNQKLIHELEGPLSPKLSNFKDNVEEVPLSISRIPPVISIIGLAKSFKSISGVVQAVRNLSLDIYEGQITALLGHNSAGKSTTIKMITGTEEPSKGDILIDGHSIQSSDARQHVSFGLCPQHNVLFDHLTVVEHLELFAALKGVPKKNVYKEVRRLVRALDLTSFAPGFKPKPLMLVNQPSDRSLDDVKEITSLLAEGPFAQNLSGGTQRKLSLAIAIIGKPRVLVLDEPTASMDPLSRRRVWEILRKLKPGRVTILTTHFLDEADSLGDRIAFMAKGSLYCAGSSLFLKNKFGVGYSMHFTAKSFSSEDFDEKGSTECGGDFDSKSILALVQSYVPAAQKLSAIHNEMTVRLPFTATEQFPLLLNALDERKESFGIGGVGISVTTLEEVFLRIAKYHEDVPENNAEDEEKRAAYEADDLRQADKDCLPVNQRLRDEKLLCPNAATQFYALLWKKYILYKRAWKSRLCELFMTFGIVSLAVAIIAANLQPEGPPLSLSSSAFSRITYNGYRVPTSQILYPSGQLDSEVLGYLSKPYVPMTGVGRPEVDSYNLSLYMLETAKHHDGSRYISYVPQDALVAKTVLEHSKERPSPVQIALSEVNASSLFSYNMSVGAYNLSILHNVTCEHSIPIASAELTQATLRKLLRNPSATYKLTNHPLPIKSEVNLYVQATLGILASLFILIPLSYLPASFVVPIVKERYTKARTLQSMTGVHASLYWISNFLVDLLWFSIVGFGVMLAVIQFYKSDSLSQEVLRPLLSGEFALLLISFGISIVPFSYLLSLAFTNPRTALIGIAAFHFVFGFVLVVVSYILDQVDATKGINVHLKTIYRIFPAFALGEGLISLTSLPLRNYLTNSNLTRWEVISPNVTTMCYMCAACVVLLVLVDSDVSKRVFRWLSDLIYRPNVSIDIGSSYGEEEDADVALERERVEKMSSDGIAHQVVYIRNLRKIFGGLMGVPKCAVENTSLAIAEGECFGLLGANAAGKSTTLKMLTGEEVPSFGSISVFGQSHASAGQRPSSKALKNIGYCPQFDPLLEAMTGREHLKFYAILRGIPMRMIDDAVEEIIDLLKFSEFADRSAESYSGGNKRKLSLGIALIGGPPLIILDEPSAGMDPVAKRLLWKAVSTVKESRCIVLTTHSMEECEALCDRTAIMVSGGLKCLGSLSHLKQRFGTGFQVQLRVSEEFIERAIFFLQTDPIFEKGVIEEVLGNNIKILVPVEAAPLSQLFDVIEKEKLSLGVLFYSVSQCSLEQIFLSITRKASAIDGNHQALDIDFSASAVLSPSKPDPSLFIQAPIAG